MRIGELARRTGISERALRYYEEQGLLRPARLPSGYRVYAESDVAAVRRVRLLLAAGLSTAQIAEAMPCVVDADDLPRPDCAGLVEVMVAHRDRIDEAIGELESTRANLDALIARGRGAG